MKVLLLNPPWDGIRAGSRWPFKTGKRKEYRRGEYLTYPFWLCYTSSLLKQNGHEARVIDAIAEHLSHEEFLKIVMKEDPDLIVIETSTPSINVDYNYAKLFSKKFKVVLTGTHVSVLFEEALHQVPEAIIARGEYEYTLLDLANSKDLNKIPGIVYLESGEIKINRERELIEDLDSLPFPDRDSVPIYRYWDGFCQHWPAVQMISSRGCLFRCIFCVWNAVMDKFKWRPRTPSNVVDEIEYCIRKYHFKEVYFDDSTFNMKPDHVYDICEELIAKKIKIPWSAMCSSVTLSYDMLKRMKEAGCIGIKFGVESADENVLRKIKKPLDLEKIQMIGKWCKKLRIKTHATFVIGLPGENEETIEKTLNFMKKLDVDSMQVSIATPFPGTEFFEMATKENWLRVKSWEMFSGSDSCVISYPNLSREKIENGFREANKIILRKKVKNLRCLMSKLPVISRSPFHFLRILYKLWATK